MPRFSVSFGKRKPAVDEFPNGNVASPERPSFRVIERPDVSGARSFDGGARMARASKILTPKTNFIELGADDNIFANLKPNRGSGVSNTTNTTSTDNSSCHSNTSTAPSSTDMASANAKDGKDDAKQAVKPAPSESPSRGSSKSSFLDRATRTFSFGGQKKHTIPPPKETYVPDVPPVLRLNDGSRENRSRGMTTSSVSTATPAHPTGGGELDLGGDFGAMFSSFDKRASTATLTIAGAKPTNPTSSPSTQLSPHAPATSGHASGTPPPVLLRNRKDDDQSPPERTRDAQPAQSLHTNLNSFRSSTRQPSGPLDDEDAKLLRESFTALHSLTAFHEKPNRLPPPGRAEGPPFPAPAKPPPVAEPAEEENMFAGSPSRRPQPRQRHVPQPTISARNKVMTPAQFEQYRQDKERQGRTEQAVSTAAVNEEEEDDINYDDDEDEQEKSKQQARQRRKQEAHMTIYRQQMMKVTGDTTGSEAPRLSRPGLLSSPSAPQLSLAKPVSPDAAVGAPDGDEDEDVPLGILQANGFPSKNRPPTRMSHGGPPSTRLSQGAIPPTRPTSVAGESLAGAARRHSMLPAFARNLPQDPFSGPTAARPPHGRESMLFTENAGLAPVPPQQAPHQAGGLVGVIQNEERFRAMRRGSPSVDGPKLFGAVPHGNFDAAAAAPTYPMMYGAGPPPPPSLTPGDQAQIQMTQQMQQFMQMQMHFMHMMAANQNGPTHQSQASVQSPYGVVGLPGTQSMADLSSRHSFVGDQSTEPRRMDHGMRSMSMVQPGPVPAPYMAPPPIPAAPVMHGAAAGYTPSIAPSERSNVGLPGRYRPVSQASASPAQGHSHRASTFSIGPSKMQGGGKSMSTARGHEKPKEADVDDDDDEEQGWEAMKEKRDKKRSMWKKKSFGSELAFGLGSFSR